MYGEQAGFTRSVPEPFNLKIYKAVVNWAKVSIAIKVGLLCTLFCSAARPTTYPPRESVVSTLVPPHAA